MKNYVHINDLNQQFQTAPEQAISAVNCAFRKQLHTIAEEIRTHVRQSPVILIAGPSGSGKTTTAKMLEEIFDRSNMETHTIALDNYFRTIPKEDYPLIASGQLDLESPERLNSELLSDHLRRLIACEPVELPCYDFTETTSRPSGIILQRKPDEPIILEGIHALNPDAIRLPEHQRVALYVSVQTHITCGTQTIHPLYLRLLRRMIRDRNSRGRVPQQTLAMLPEVERGKQRFIQPFRCHATHEIDTFHAYEPGVYRSVLLPELEKLEQTEELSILCGMLRNVSPIDADLIPETSLVREFLGGGLYA